MLATVLALAILGQQSWHPPGARDHDIAPAWGHKVSVSASVTTWVGTGTTATSSTGAIRLHPWGSHLRIKCAAAVCACLVMDRSVTLNAGASCGGVVDPGTPGHGVGACNWILANTPDDIFVTHEALTSGTPGYRAASCSAPAARVGDPCDANADCVGGGGSCAGTNPLGAFLALISDSGAATCAIVEGK